MLNSSSNYDANKSYQADAEAAPSYNNNNTSRVSSTRPPLVTVLDWPSLNLLLAFFSLVVLIDASRIQDIEDEGVKIYQIVGPAGSAVLAILTVALVYCGKLESELARKALSLFQFLWWVAGVIVLTFFGSYQSTTNANGYFGAWFACVVATLMLISTFPTFEHHLESGWHSPRKPIFFLIACSLVVLGSSLDQCINGCGGYFAWALAMSAISLFLSLVVFIIVDRVDKLMLQRISQFLILWWTLGTLINTFGGPFLFTGNGYFFSYASFVASIAVYQTVKD